MIGWFKKFFAVPMDEPVPVPPVRLVKYPHGHKFKNNATKKFFWNHPPGYPYQVYGGPHCPYPRNAPTKDQRQVWADTWDIPGYKLTEDYYTDRLYLVWQDENYINKYEPSYSAFGTTTMKEEFRERPN